MSIFDIVTTTEIYDLLTQMALPDCEMLSDGNFMINIPSMSALETRTIHMTYGALGLKSESQPLDEYQLPGELGMEFIDEAIGHWPLDDLGAIEWYGTTFYLDSFASAYDVHNSIAVDSNHNIHISYLDRTNLDLKYVTFDGTNWSSPIQLIQTVCIIQRYRFE